MNQPTTNESTGDPWKGRKYFTLKEANRALVSISKILPDIEPQYRDLVNLQGGYNSQGLTIN